MVHPDVVAGSSPASGTKCRSSSVVEHVFPVRFLSVGFSAGRRLWVIGTVGWRFKSALLLDLVSRWPMSSGGGLQNRRGWCDSSTGFHFFEHRC